MTSGRVFDDLDLASYVEEFLSLKVDEIGANLERTMGDRLLDLVETNRSLLEKLERLERATEQKEAAPAPDLQERLARLQEMTEKARRDAGVAVQRLSTLHDQNQSILEEVRRLQEQQQSQATDRSGNVAADQARRQEIEASLQGELAAFRDELAAGREERAALQAQLSEVGKKGEAYRADAIRAHEKLNQARERHESAVRALEVPLREENARLQATIEALRTELAEALEKAEQGHEMARDTAREEVLRSEKEITRLEDDLRRAGDAFHGLQEENRALTARLEDAQKTEKQAGAARKLQEEVHRLREDNRLLQERLEDAQKAEKEAGGTARDTRLLLVDLKEKLAAGKRRIAELEQGQKDLADLNRSLQDELDKVRSEPEVDPGREAELQAKVDSLVSKNQALTESLRSYSDPEKFTTLKLRELHQQLQNLEATMREKDRLLSEGGKDQLLLGQELEKVRKEKYEAQVGFERRIKELQEQLARETREKEKERQERHLMEEQIARTKQKKWPW